MITEGTLFIVQTEEGFVVTEATNYTYLDEKTAKAFARDKWGQENPRMATEDGYTCQTILAQRFAHQFFDIPIAVTVLDGKVYGAYIGDYMPYELNAHQPMVAALALHMGLFKVEHEGEINGKPVTWWMNRRQDEPVGK